MLFRFCFSIVPKLATNYTSCACKTNYVAREGRYMTKLISGSKKKSKNWYSDPPTLPVNIFSKQKNPDKKTSRRAVVLNHVFMTHITELLATGEYAGEVSDEKISITKVSVHPDYKGVNVYWYKKTGAVDENTEILIRKLSGYLFHQLTSLRIIGRVPPVTFVKDKDCFNASQVDFLLEQLGLNNTSVDPIKIDLGYETSNNSSESQEFEDENEDPLPLMRHNVYGLDHSKIMNRLKDIVRKRNLVHSGNFNKNVEKIVKMQVTKSQESNYVEFDKKEYAKFLKKKRAERNAMKVQVYNLEDDYYDNVNNYYDDDSDWKQDEDEWYDTEDDR